MKRVYKCEYCYLKNTKPCYECSACMSGDDHFRPAKPEKKRTTNADRIRAMSDEELAVWLVKKTVYQESAFSCPSYLNFLTELDDTKESAIKGTVEWLQMPAEGEG